MARSRRTAAQYPRTRHRRFPSSGGRSIGRVLPPTMSPSPSSRRPRAVDYRRQMPSPAESSRRRARRAWRVGAYHFFTFCRPGADQAQNFIATVPREQAAAAAGCRYRVRRQLPQRPSLEEFDARTLLLSSTRSRPAFGKPAIIYLIGEAARRLCRPDRRSPALGPFAGACIQAMTTWIYLAIPRHAVASTASQGDVDLNVLQGEAASIGRAGATAQDPISPETPLSPENADEHLLRQHAGVGVVARAVVAAKTA